MKKGLALAGGSIKGAYQVGAIRALAESGFVPDYVSGCSVGSINGILLVDAMAEMNFQEAAGKLWNIWSSEVRSPESIIKKKRLKLAVEIVKNRFNGVSSTKPLESLIKKYVRLHRVRKSPCKIFIGAVDFHSGQVRYAEAHQDLFKWVLASSAIPILMPYVEIEGRVFVDLGVRDSAPITPLAKAGCGAVVLLANHPADFADKPLNTGNIKEYSEHLLDLYSMDNLNDNIKLTESYNESPGNGKRYIDFSVHRPSTKINLKLTKFKPKDIRRLMDQGYEETKARL